MDINIAQVGRDFATKPTNNDVAQLDSTSVSDAQRADAALNRATFAAPDTVSNATAVEIQQAVTEITESLQTSTRQLSFSIDDNSARTIVSVVDQASGDIIRQIPSAEFLKIAEKLKTLDTDRGSAIGILVNKQI